MIIVLWLLAFLMAAWSVPNKKERKDIWKNVLCLLIFGSASVVTTMIALKTDLSVYCFIPLIIGYFGTPKLEDYVNKVQEENK